MFDSQTQEIKDKLDIAEVLSGYIRLIKAGRNFKALCPFHSEKTPSFVVSPDRQIWHCFGCGEGGDIFTFVMKIEGVEFPEALKILAERAGVQLKKTNVIQSSKKSKILEVLQKSKIFYSNSLNKTQAGISAKKYLLGRGLAEKSLNDFEIGYAPDSYDETKNFLISAGFGQSEIYEAGMLVKSERDGSYYDRFRGRIMFPISDILGRTVGFGARVFVEKEAAAGAKYINTPDTLVYNKSRILYGLDFAREHIRKENACVLVEGYIDVIGSHQMTVKNAVATSGTALTEEHLKIIRRYSENLILAFDGDRAGQEATQRSIDLAIENSMAVKAIILPADKDPSDFVGNPAEWKERVKKAKRIIDFYFENSFAKNNPETVEGKKIIAGELLKQIKKIPNRIEQAHWIEALSEKLGIDSKLLFEELKKIKSGDSPAVKKEDNFSASGGSALGGKTKANSSDIELESHLLALICALPNIEEKISQLKEAEFVFSDADASQIYASIVEAREKRPLPKNLPRELKKTLPERLFEKLNHLIFKAEQSLEPEGKAKEGEKAFKRLLGRILFLRYRARHKKLERDIKLAEKNKDYAARELFIKEFNEVAGKMKKLAF